MRKVFLGAYIKQRRLALGLTQKQVCEGICESITLSRVENGGQTPAYNRLKTILQRLGLRDDQYVALLRQGELKVNSLLEEIRADSIRFERASDEKRPTIRAAGLEKLAELETIIAKDDRITRQAILGYRAAVFGKPDGPYRPEEQLDMLLEALRMTVPNIDLEEINCGWYSMDEATLINKIAIAYDMMGQRKKAIDIYRQLLKYVQKHDKALKRYAGKFSLIAHNYARELFLEKRYEETLEVAELGRKTCVEYRHYQFLPGLLDLLGGCHFFMGDQEQCKEYYRCAYYIYKAIGNEHDRLLLEQAAKERLGRNFQFNVHLCPDPDPPGAAAGASGA